MKTKTLLLVPTGFEADLLLPLLNLQDRAANVVTELCGFGPVVAGARTMQLLNQHQPQHVILAGIAGSLSDTLAIGSASRFSRVAIFGVGAGSGEEFQTADELGWVQLAESPECSAIRDTINLASTSEEDNRLLITSCAASGNAIEADWRRRNYPNADAEDMEGFSVAAACQMADVPLEIVRGISNVAGDRDKQNWNIEAAIQAAAQLVMERLR